MKTIGIVLSAIAGLVLAIVIFFYFAVSQFPKLMAEYAPEISVSTQQETQKAEAKLSAASDDYSRWVTLGNALYWQSTQANADGVSAKATALLVLAERYQDDWNYGNALHKANSALGRIALHSGDKVAARKYLLDSARSKGSPQMNSFGPNMGFAKEMLEAGETDVVLEYFALCRQFWTDHGQLDVWTRMIRDGKPPRFGASLLY